VQLQDDGTVQFIDQSEAPLPAPLECLAKKQQGERVRAWLKEQCQAVNDSLELLEKTHLETPPPDHVPAYHIKALAVPEPSKTTLAQPGLLKRKLPWRGRRLDLKEE